MLVGDMDPTVQLAVHRRMVPPDRTAVLMDQLDLWRPAMDRQADQRV